MAVTHILNPYNFDDRLAKPLFPFPRIGKLCYKIFHDSIYIKYHIVYTWGIACDIDFNYDLLNNWISSIILILSYVNYGLSIIILSLIWKCQPFVSQFLDKGCRKINNHHIHLQRHDRH